MKTTILKFPSFVYLTAFRKFSKATHWEISIAELTVLCDCSAEEARFACNDFKAIELKNRDENSENQLPRRPTWEFASAQYIFRLPSN